MAHARCIYIWKTSHTLCTCNIAELIKQNISFPWVFYGFPCGAVTASSPYLLISLGDVILSWINKTNLSNSDFGEMVLKHQVLIGGVAYGHVTKYSTLTGKWPRSLFHVYFKSSLGGSTKSSWQYRQKYCSLGISVTVKADFFVVVFLLLFADFICTGI